MGLDAVKQVMIIERKKKYKYEVAKDHWRLKTKQKWRAKEAESTWRPKAQYHSLKFY